MVFPKHAFISNFCKKCRWKQENDYVKQCSQCGGQTTAATGPPQPPPFINLSKVAAAAPLLPQSSPETPKKKATLPEGEEDENVDEEEIIRSDILVMPVQASKSPEKKSGASASTGASPTAESTVTQPVTIAAVSVTIDASSGERLLWYRPSDLASGHYLPYVSEEWEQSEDGEWERVLESLFKACEDWIRKPHNISGRNGKKTLKIPPGAYTSSSTVLKTMILRSSSGGGKLRSKTILQSATPKAQNCVVASISNCIYVLVEGKDYADTLKAKMRREIDATENVRGPWPKCGDTVEQLSEGVAKVCFKKTFLQNSKTARVDMAFFFSEDPASYGCFVVQVTTKDGSHDHVLAFIRNDMDNNANNYIVDSNPLNGSFALPFTKQQLDKIDAVGIHFAVKIVLKDGK